MMEVRIGKASKNECFAVMVWIYPNNCTQIITIKKVTTKNK
jgi:hypothetical protein